MLAVMADVPKGQGVSPDNPIENELPPEDQT
jgi:hypothetical protein